MLNLEKIKIKNVKSPKLDTFDTVSLTSYCPKTIAENQQDDEHIWSVHDCNYQINFTMNIPCHYMNKPTIKFKNIYSENIPPIKLILDEHSSPLHE